ncbi:hypothetical protein KBI52_10185, partial [Microvirga sp. HBU67558]|uniref:hypothetical protein n=1 Tax=Microvirga sp. HBU67558 TaxID=2824562 RepID=UPI001B369212
AISQSTRNPPEWIQAQIKSALGRSIAIPATATAQHGGPDSRFGQLIEAAGQFVNDPAPGPACRGSFHHHPPETQECQRRGLLDVSIMTRFPVIGSRIVMGSPLALRHRTNAVPAVWINFD